MYKFKIESMNCKSCLHNIADTLKDVDSSSNASANFETKTLEVESKLSSEVIKKLIEDAGYPAKEIS